MSDADPGSRATDAALCATAAVALRWWPAGREDPAQLETESAAGLRALEACLESDGARQAGGAQARLEAKVDLLLVTLERVGATLAVQADRGGRRQFLHCDAIFRPCSVEWGEPMLLLPPDGTPVIVEIRAAAGQPVATRLAATLARRPAESDVCTSTGTTIDASTRVRATLAPMAPPLRDAYERCVFILHRQAVRRGTAGSDAD